MLLVLLQNTTERLGNKMPAVTEVVGKAIYLELVEPEKYKSTWEDVRQIIILPSYTADSGEDYPAVIMDRGVNELSPKAQWEFSRYSMGVGTTDDVLTNPEHHKVIENSLETDRIVPNFQYSPDGTNKWNVSDEASISFEAREALWLGMTNDERNKSRARAMELSLRNHLLTLRSDEDSNEYTEARWIPRDEVSPMIVEVTNDDMELAIQRKTPQALIRRIQKLRVAKSLPEKVVITKS